MSMGACGYDISVNFLKYWKWFANFFLIPLDSEVSASCQSMENLHSLLLAPGTKDPKTLPHFLDS